MKFIWEFCEACGAYFIRCPKCGNNCCNGGYGKINGEECDICFLCYQFQNLAYENNLVPEITGEDLSRVKQYQNELDKSNQKQIEEYYQRKSNDEL
jgi:hypothetical protein